MRVTMVALTACSLLGLAGARAEAGIPLSDLVRESPEVEVASPGVEVAQLGSLPTATSVTSPGVGVPTSVTPGTTAPNIAAGSVSVGTTTPATSVNTPTPTAVGAPLTSAAVNQANVMQQSMPSSALPPTTEPVPPSPSSIAPQPTQATNGFVPQAAAPTSGGLFNQFNNAPTPANAPPNTPAPISNSITVGPPSPTSNPNNETSTNGGANPNVPGWDHP